jgi:hypothetical protein
MESDRMQSWYEGIDEHTKFTNENIRNDRAFPDLTLIVKTIRKRHTECAKRKSVTAISSTCIGDAINYLHRLRNSSIAKHPSMSQWKNLNKTDTKPREWKSRSCFVSRQQSRRWSQSIVECLNHRRCIGHVIILEKKVHCKQKESSDAKSMKKVIARLAAVTETSMEEIIISWESGWKKNERRDRGNNKKSIAKIAYETNLADPGLTKIADMLRGQIDGNRSRSIQRWQRKWKSSSEWVKLNRISSW